MADQIRDGAQPKLCAVCYYLTWATLCFRVKWDAKTRLQSPSESHVLQTAACVPLPSSPGLPHLRARPRRRRAVLVRVEPPAESKKIAALHRYAREGSQRCRTHARRVEEVPRYQMATLWRAFVCRAEATATASDEFDENMKHFINRPNYNQSCLRKLLVFGF